MCTLSLGRFFMFLARRPSRLVIDRFTARSQELSLSSTPVGLAQGHAPRYQVDELIVPIGRGSIDFDRAKAALVAWKPFDLGWVQLFPERASVTPGNVVTVLVRHGGFWSLNGCRIVYGLGDRQRGVRFGFAYGTLSNHAASGEELFEVSLQPDTEDVLFRIRACVAAACAIGVSRVSVHARAAGAVSPGIGRSDAARDRRFHLRPISLTILSSARARASPMFHPGVTPATRPISLKSMMPTLCPRRSTCALS